MTGVRSGVALSGTDLIAKDHPHVTRLFDVYEADDQLYLVMDCMEVGKRKKQNKQTINRL